MRRIKKNNISRTYFFIILNISVGFILKKYNTNKLNTIPTHNLTIIERVRESTLKQKVMPSIKVNTITLKKIGLIWAIDSFEYIILRKRVKQKENAKTIAAVKIPNRGKNMIFREILIMDPIIVITVVVIVFSFAIITVSYISPIADASAPISIIVTYLYASQYC